MDEQTVCEVKEMRVGKITVACRGEAIVRLSFGEDIRDGEKREGNEWTGRAFEELEEYFLGRRREFDLPLSPDGTEFQKKVWAALREIPYGETRSYSEIAGQVGNPKAVRAVGMANHRNPIAIMIPCHRVIGKNGSLTGYAGGLDLKERLLKLEHSER